MRAALLAPVFVFAVCDWLAVARSNKRADYFFKPAALGALLAAAYILGDDLASARKTLLLIALGASLLGDIFLMLPRDFFVQGLASFLVGHLAYIAAFDPARADRSMFFVVLFVAAIPASILFVRVVRGLRAQGLLKLVLPVALYAGVITVMLASAIARGITLQLHVASAAIVGALSFYLSDSLIGWHRFVRPLPWAPLVIIATYHLAQIALVLALTSSWQTVGRV